MATYQPIENYGIVGNLETVALIGLNGSIDFCCFPDFDSPTIFGSLLDKDKGGYFRIYPFQQDMKSKQLYIPDTNVLLTRFLCKDGVGEITDFMPMGNMVKDRTLVRSVTNIRGRLTYKIQCRPRFDYASAKHNTEKLSETEVLFKYKNTTLHLKSSIPLEIDDNDCIATFTLNMSETAHFVLQFVENSEAPFIFSDKVISDYLKKTIQYWRKWIGKSNYKGRWMEMVNRSALVLKLLTSKKYGSIIAAPTFSLPEEIGGERNWDYRYTWIRDASFTIYALIKLDFKEEAQNFINWVEYRCENIKEGGSLGLMYSIRGDKKLNEKKLAYLEGYKKSSPVRIGNNAENQIQLDIYGELIDSIYLYTKQRNPISHRLWKSISSHVEWLSVNWERPDHGIWEIRGDKKVFLHSRLMSWVAFDRAIKIAKIHSFPFPRDLWYRERDKIYDSIFKDFWNSDIQSFVQFKGSNVLDASLLLMPIVKFISPTDPCWLSTLKNIEKELVTDSLVFRYKPGKAAGDGLKGEEGTFTMFSFLYIDCLARAGELDKARLYLEKMFGYANHVGLYSEQLGACTEHLGNFPQAFSHMALISTARGLNRRLNQQNRKKTSTEG